MVPAVLSSTRGRIGTAGAVSLVSVAVLSASRLRSQASTADSLKLDGLDLIAERGQVTALLRLMGAPWSLRPRCAQGRGRSPPVRVGGDDSGLPVRPACRLESPGQWLAGSPSSMPARSPREAISSLENTFLRW